MYRQVQSINKKKDENQSVSIKLFDETEILDDDIRQMLNDRMADLKTSYDNIAKQNAAYNKDLSEKIAKYKALRPEFYDFVDMKIDDICEILKVCCPDVENLWPALEKAYTI